MNKNKILLSVARIWGFLSLLFLIYMLLGHIFGEDTIVFSSRKEMIAFVFFPMGIIFGLFVAYRSSLTGGSITLVSTIMGILFLPALIGNFYYLFCVLPGVLFFIHGLSHLKAK